MKEYIKKALKFEPNEEQYNEIIQRLSSPQKIRILHGLIGIITESGELFDQFKKHIFYGKELDLVNLVEEIGDLDWYRAITVDALSKLMNVESEKLNFDIYEKNISKLTKRYNDKFSQEAAINRNTDQERIVLERETCCDSHCDPGDCNYCNQ